MRQSKNCGRQLGNEAFGDYRFSAVGWLHRNDGQHLRTDQGGSVSLLIEDSVPLPEPDYARLCDAFREMKIGQSVVFTGSHCYIHALAANCAIRIKVRALSGKIALRGLKEYRIWRTA